MSLPNSIKEIQLKFPDLSEGEVMFAFWLKERLPKLTGLWDWESGNVSFERVDEYLATASHGEAIMCRFAVGIWRWKNERDFDLIEAGQVLDSHNMAIISEWAKRPWFVG